MKKIFVSILMFVILITFGCTQQTNVLKKDGLTWNLKDRQYYLGRLSRLEMEDLAIDAASSHFATTYSLEQRKRSCAFNANCDIVKYGRILYDDAATLLLGLKRGDVKMAFVPSFVGEYIAHRDSDIHVLDINTSDKIAEQMGYTWKVSDNLDVIIGNISFRLATLPEKAQLCNRLNVAIASMRKDGTLEKLQKKYIEDVINDEDPKPIELEHVDGRETISFVITGDLAPMDYISVDGRPAGFNVAVLAEVGKRLGCNIEFVVSNTTSRLINLKTGKADAIFWTRTPDYEYWNSYDNSGLVMTEPYYSCGQCYIYTDYPLEYLMENELFYTLPEREEYMMTCLYWRLAQYYFKQTPKEYPFYGPSDYEAEYLDLILDDERAKLGSEESLSEFLMKYKDIKPWELHMK